MRADDLGEPRAGQVDWAPIAEALPEGLERLADRATELSAFGLDRRMQAVVGALQRIDWQTGRLLATLFKHRLHRLLGFPTTAAYVHERLGMSPRKARALVALDRKSSDTPALTAAYREGELSWLRGLAILPVTSDRTAAAWIMRARSVTVRRLVDEVDRRHPSVRGTMRAVMAQLRAASRPRPCGLAASAPASRPVFARDGWRCAVPACTARRNLHDHHLLYRSRGGGNARDNRITVCAWHHLRGIHQGRVRAWGTAPDVVTWELGARPGCEPLLRLRGDEYVHQ